MDNFDDLNFDRMATFLRNNLAKSVSDYQSKILGVTVELATIEEHEAFIPSIMELLSREEYRGTQGMTGHLMSEQQHYLHISQEFLQEQAFIVYAGKELIGYATIALWDFEDSSFVEFCSAVVDDEFRGMGFGRLLVDARELVVVERYIPQGYRPVAFCNNNSAKIYNENLWNRVDWEEYRHLTPPLLCSTSCERKKDDCHCIVLSMDIDWLNDVSSDIEC